MVNRPRPVGPVAGGSIGPSGGVRSKSPRGPQLAPGANFSGADPDGGRWETGLALEGGQLDRQGKADTGQATLPRCRAPRTRLLGAELDDLSAAEVVAAIFAVLDGGGRARVINANAYMLNLTHETPWLRALFRQSEIAFFDGAGAQLAAQVLTGHRPRRTTPPEWAAEVAAGVAQRNGSVYLLGGAAEAAATAAERLATLTGVRVAGFHHGFFDATPGSPEAEAVLDEINRLRPDVLFLNMGMPRQERWLHDFWDRADVSVAVTAGALVDHLAGRVRRPPRWVADLGFEWLVRLAVEPRRLWRRYVIGLPVFGFRVLREKLLPRRREDEA